MKVFKPLSEYTDVAPTGYPFGEDITTKHHREREQLMNNLEQAIKEKIHGAVRVRVQFGKYVEVEVYNDRFDFKYSFEEPQILLCDTEMIVFDFLYHYKESILKRYIKEEGVDK